MLKEAIEEEKTPKEIVLEMKEAMAKFNIPENVSLFYNQWDLYFYLDNSWVYVFIVFQKMFSTFEFWLQTFLFLIIEAI